MPIRTPQNTGGNWIYEFNQEFSFWLNNFAKIGQFQFLKVEEIQRNFKNSSWLDYKNCCPYLSKIAGYINWEWWTTDNVKFEDKESILLEWMSFSNSHIIRLDKDLIFDLVKVLEYPLNDIQSTYGFEQGQVFLKNVSQDYYDDLKSKVRNKLAQKSIACRFPKNQTTGRNELYISSWISEREMDNEILEFWGFDLRATYGESWKKFITGKY